MESAYIHIPFCKSKCKYCSFVSYPKLELKEEYLSALSKEIKAHYKGELLRTLYFGGGTPSLLSADEFENIIKLFNIDKNTEITAEFNPECKITKPYPINRVSFGCQTFDDEILKLIGRRHNSSDIKTAVKSAKDSGINNISLDLIYGLPNQTLEMFENDINQAVSLDVQHISLYGLKLDEGCYFAKYPPKNIPDLDCQADMYLKAVNLLKDYGFEHYEISNFSKYGFYSRHNLNYWNNANYYGFGAAAHGYENNVRYSNPIDLKNYIKNPTEHAQTHTLTKQERLEEEIFLGFRKMSGIQVNKINKKFGINFEQKYSQILQKYSEFFEKTEQSYKLNLNGILISNNILSEFLETEE